MGVYRPGGGLRMLGSLKVKKGAVVGNGRKYAVQAVLESNGNLLSPAALQKYRADQLQVLHDISIHPTQSISAKGKTTHP